MTAILIRFGVGAGVSAVASAIALAWGPRAGGVFLAFPAILLAALTLVAKEEGLKAARDDARGAAVGSVGMLTFASVCSLMARPCGGLVALGAATAAWALVSVGGYLLVRRMGYGSDERLVLAVDFVHTGETVSQAHHAPPTGPDGLSLRRQVCASTAGDDVCHRKP